MSLLEPRYLLAAACVFASAAGLAPRGALAIPIAPAPTLERQIADAQYGARPGPRRAIATTRPVRPMVRPVRPGVRPVRPGVRPPVVRPVPPGVRPGRPVVVRPGYHGGWYRPYRWRPGGAIAAGVAIGVLSAAAAAAYYNAPPPAPGLCWYYTDPSRTSGFWDVCP